MESEQDLPGFNINQYHQVETIQNHTHQYRIVFHKEAIKKRYKMAEMMKGLMLQYELDIGTNQFVFKKEIKIEILRTPMISKGTYKNLMLNQLGKVNQLKQKSNDKDYPESLMKYHHIFYKQQAYMFYVISEYFESAVPLELCNVEPLVLLEIVSDQLLAAFEYLTKIGVFTSFLTILIDKDNRIKISDFGLIHALNEVNNEYSIESNVCIDYAKDYLSLDDYCDLILSSEEEKIYEGKQQVYYPFLLALIIVNKITQHKLKQEGCFQMRESMGENWHEASLLLRCTVLKDEQEILDYEKSYKSQVWRIKQLLEQFQRKTEVKEQQKQEEISIRLLKAQATDFKDQNNKLQPWLKLTLEFLEKNVFKPYRCRSRLSEIRQFFHKGNWLIIDAIKDYYNPLDKENNKGDEETLEDLIDHEMIPRQKVYQIYETVATSMSSAQPMTKNEIQVLRNVQKEMSSTLKDKVPDMQKLNKNFQYEKILVRLACYASQFRQLIKLGQKLNENLTSSRKKYKENEQEMEKKQRKESDEKENYNKDLEVLGYNQKNEKKRKKGEKNFKNQREKDEKENKQLKKMIDEMQMLREGTWKRIKQVYERLEFITKQINEHHQGVLKQISSISQLQVEIQELLNSINEINIIVQKAQQNFEEKEAEKKTEKKAEKLSFKQRIQTIPQDKLKRLQYSTKCIFDCLASFFYKKLEVLENMKKLKQIIVQKLSETQTKLLLRCVDNLTSDLIAGLLGRVIFNCSSEPEMKPNSIKLLTLIEVIISKNKIFQGQVQKLSLEDFIQQILNNQEIKKGVVDEICYPRYIDGKPTAETVDSIASTGKHQENPSTNDTVS